MSHLQQLDSFIAAIEQSFANHSFAKLTLGHYKGNETELKNVYVKKVIIKGQHKLGFTLRYKTRDIVKNYSVEESKSLLFDYLSNGFRVANLFTLAFDLQFEYLPNEKIKLRTRKASHTELPETTNDRNKKRHLEANASAYLHDLHITSSEGIVLKHAQDKYKQINHYIELLNPLLKNLPTDKPIEVADMGAGKGYLTFALYDYLKNKLNLPVHITGVEFRADLVALCNEVAIKNKFNDLHFVEGSIEAYDCKQVNILIALHACDTATDDAIYKGIQANADLIVVAPCCHKQIRNEIEHGKKHNELDFMLRHGIYLEREAEMVTDSIRALLLEYCGYRIKVFEFISEAHTPKNVMIIGERIHDQLKVDKAHILQKVKEAKTYFGISKHYLEVRLGLL